MVKGFDYKEIGRRIKDLRGRARQKDWAGRIGCDQGYISQVENGVTKPSLAFLRGVGSITNASIDWILTGKGPKSLGLARHKEGAEPGSPSGLTDYTISELVADPSIKAGVDRLLSSGTYGRALLKAFGEMDDRRVEGIAMALDLRKR
jgi:transcriptional regulator with XRE-family HTH domain